MMLIKRLISKLIDLVVTFTPVYLVNIFGMHYSIITILYFWLVLYFFATTYFLLVGEKTIGDVFLKIKIKSLAGNLKKFTIIKRNFVLSFFLLLIILDLNDVLGFVLSLIIFIGVDILVFSKNKYDKPMTALDLLFKTYYDKC